LIEEWKLSINGNTSTTMGGEGVYMTDQLVGHDTAKGERVSAVQPGRQPAREVHRKKNKKQRIISSHTTIHTKKKKKRKGHASIKRGGAVRARLKCLDKNR